MVCLAEHNECTGCNACVSACPYHCIQMKADENGFLYPDVDYDKCVSCAICESTCPIKQPAIEESNKTKAYAAYSLDETLRLQSSSGGIFSELAKEVLEQGGVVCGAAYMQQFAVSHTFVEKESDLKSLRGAKYAQSNLGDCLKGIKSYLQKGRQVLFSGTPCQVAGLKSFLKISYANLFCIDFVCHGVPSPAAWQNYVKYRAEKDNQGRLPQSINLRSKISGWSRYHYSSRYEYSDGEYLTRNGEDLFMNMFVENCLSRASCSQCHYKGYDRISDITIGDFWGIWDIYPEMDDDKGTSVVLVHSDRGNQLLSRIKKRVRIKEVSLADASQQNPSLMKSSGEHDQRDLILSLFNDGNIAKAEKVFNQENQTVFLEKLKNYLHKIKR